MTFKFTEPKTLQDCAQLVVDNMQQYIDGKPHDCAWNMDYYIHQSSFVDEDGKCLVCLAGDIFTQTGKQIDPNLVEPWMEAIDSIRQGLIARSKDILDDKLDLGKNYCFLEGKFEGFPTLEELDRFTKPDAPIRGRGLHIEKKEKYEACRDEWIEMKELLAKYDL